MAEADFDEGALILAWCRGNRDAANMIAALFEASHLADDVVDGDSRDVCADMTRLLATLFSRVMTNRFFLAHAERISGSVIAAAVDWNLSTEWQTSTDEVKRTYSYVLRETLEHIIVIVADLVDGPEHAMAVRRQIMGAYHLGKQREELADFAREHA